MRAFIASALAVLSISSFATEVYVTEHADDNRFQKFDTKIVINKDLGRAAVKVLYTTYWGEDDDEEIVVVKGLSYEAPNVIFTKESGDKVVCGTYRKGSFFRNPGVKMSDNCSFETKTITKTFDDGFRIKQRDYKQLFLNVQ